MKMEKKSTASTAARYPAPALMTIFEAAQAARVPVSSMREWIAKARIPSRKPGKRVLVRRFDLAVFLDVPEIDLELERAT